MSDAAARILEGFATVPQYAQAVDRTERTVLNWCREPNGLPYVKLGATRLIPIEEGNAWLKSRIIRRNPPPDRRRRR